jgi:hypothetical protein
VWNILDGKRWSRQAGQAAVDEEVLITIGLGDMPRGESNETR